MIEDDRRLYREHITTDPAILAGKPVVRGTRIGVEHVLQGLADTADIEEVLAA